jgi:NodT family efflux transporter outer membrane factor (OMF) lipoprotein
MKNALAGCILLSLLLAGCSGLAEWRHNSFEVGPNYCPPPAAVADHWIDAADKNIHSAPAENSCWWTVFNDPLLNQLIDATYRQNLSLRVAGLRICQARAQLGIAVGNFFPQKQEAATQYARNRFSANAYPFGVFPIKDNYSDWLTGFDAAWELDIWGKFRRATEAATASLDAQVDGYDDMLVMLQAEVAANYIQLRVQEQRIKFAQKNADLQADTLKLVEARFSKGQVSNLEVQQATANLETTRAMVPQFQVQERRAQNRLCILMAMPPQDLHRMLADSAAIPAAPPEVVIGIPADLLRRRPDVRAAERQAAVQSAQIGIAAAEFYPHIAITGQIGLETQYFSNWFKGSSMAGTIGPGFHWNVLNYGRIENSVRVADAQFRQAVLTYQDAVLSANEETENAMIGFLREQDRLQSLQAAATANESAVKLALLQFEKGIIDYQPLYNIQRDLVTAQDQVADSRGQVAVNLVALYKALGGGWERKRD